MTNRIGTFLVDESGWLVRRGRPRSAKNYEHRCSLAVFEEAAHTIDELGGAPFTYEDLHALMNRSSEDGVPFTQIAVVVAFLKERGILVPVRGRKHVANGADVHLDAMTEYHALREEPAAHEPTQS